MARRKISSSRRRLEQRRVLDRLYAEYGGGQLAGELQKETARGAAEVDVQAARHGNQDGTAAAKELLKVMGNAVGEVDRAAFEAQCETLGSGQRPMIMNDKAKAYFSSSSAQKECIEVAKIGRKIHALERELGLAAQ